MDSTVSISRAEAEDAYDRELARTVKSLHALADEIERSGNRWKMSPGLGGSRPEYLTRVYCAADVHQDIMRWLGGSNSYLMSLWYAAIRAEHPTSRATPAQLLDRAATEVTELGWGSTGTTSHLTPDELLRLAEAALRGAEVIR